MKCPFCDSEEGYYMIERVRRCLGFDFDGKPVWASEDVTEYSGRNHYCSNCCKILPRKMFTD